MSAPWDPDRTLTIESAAALIEKAFPSVASRGLRFLGSGWEFDAYVTMDGWVVRFPRRREASDLFERERRVEQLVADALPGLVAVPRVELLGEPAPGFPYRFAAHRFIPGIPADEVDPVFLPSLARQIALALGAIHSITEEAARAAGGSDENADDEGARAWIRQRLAVHSGPALSRSASVHVQNPDAGLARTGLPAWHGVEKLTGWAHNAFAPEVHAIRPRDRR